MRIHLAENLVNSYYIDMLREAGVKNLLFSYHSNPNLEKASKILDAVKGENIIIDSGAFSTWTLKKDINIDDYATFLKGLSSRQENIYPINLDVIPGKWGHKPTRDEIEYSAEQGWKNMEYLESKGLKPIHIFHQHEDFKWLDKLVKHQEYIGISPANDVTVKQRAVWLDKVFARIKDTRKTHGFGATSRTLLERYPWYSVDSTSWKAGARFGQSITQDYRKTGLHHQPGVFMKADLPNEIKRWQVWEKELTQLWKLRGVEW